MALDLSKIKDLTDEQKKAIMKEHDLDVAGLKDSQRKAMDDIKNRDRSTKEQEEKTRKDKEKADVEKLQNATGLEEVKKLLADERKLRQEQDQRILDNEKERVITKDKQTVDTFVDKFVSENVVNDSLVRDAIKTKISTRLGVRDGDIVELNGSELTGKTGDQVLSEIRADKGYSNHLIANNAKGGGATGGGGSGGAGTKTMTRVEFDSTSPAQVAAFVRNGGNIVD